MTQTKILVTGAAGFIGSNLCHNLLTSGYPIIGLDNLTDNYNPIFKQENLRWLRQFPKFQFIKMDILNKFALDHVLQKYHPQIVIHLAALTGVRKSLQKPKLYHSVNCEGTTNVYAAAAKACAKSFIFSSSSSVYGNNPVPFSETQVPDPRSPYAESKICAEKALQNLHTKYRLPVTILRLFSVYGPHGRPDMAPYLFTEAAYQKTSIYQYGRGNTARDYTYIADVLSAIKLVLKPKKAFTIFNIGNSRPVTLTQLIKTVERLTLRKVIIELLPQRQEEAIVTYADIARARHSLRWQPHYSFTRGMRLFAAWYKKERYDPQVKAI